MEEIIEATQLTTRDHFAQFEAQAEEWMSKAQQIKVTDASQVELIEGAREARLALRSIRINVEHKRKELKEEYLRKGNEIQSIANRLRGLIEPIEDYLEKQEDFVKIQEEEVKKKLFAERLELLSFFVTRNEASMLPLAEMTEQAFSNMLEGYKLAAEAKAKYDLEQKQIQEKQRIEKEAEDNRVRKQNEQLLRDRQIAEDKLKKEREQRLKLEREAKLKLEEEERQQKIRLAEERKAKRAPDKVKLIAFANQLDTLKCLALSDAEAQKILEGAMDLLKKTKSYIINNAEKL
jgi:hypothetical protein